VLLAVNVERLPLLAPSSLLAGEHETETPAELVAGKLEVDLAARDAVFARTLEVAKPTAVPDDHRSRPVVSLRNDGFEIEVFERMVFGLDGEALVDRIEARTSRHREALEHTAELEPEVPMAATRIVQMDDERSSERRPTAIRRFRAERFVRSRAVSFGLVRRKFLRTFRQFEYSSATIGTWPRAQSERARFPLVWCRFPSNSTRQPLRKPSPLTSYITSARAGLSSKYSAPPTTSS
jgi:hypothetical protein